MIGEDPRFSDPAWQDNPAYRALGEAYLAWTRQVHSTIDLLPLKDRQPEQLHSAADLLLESLAPTNTLLGNPAALRRAFETGGSSLVAGWTHWLQDLVGNAGMPSSVDPTGFEVGRNLAATPGHVVLRHEMFELVQYTTPGAKVRRTPMLYVPPQINRYYMIDLAPGRSFIEYCVQEGFRPFVISWRNPGPEQRDWGLDDYVAAVLEAIEAVCDISGTKSLNLAGSCTGGITATCAAAVLGSRGSDRLASLTLMVSMVDTSLPTAFNLHATPHAVALTRQFVGARGFMDGREMASVFAWMRPNEMVWNHWVNNVLMGRKPPSFDMLAWNRDTTRLPARFHGDLLDLGMENFLMRPGARTLLGEPLDLSHVDVPLYVIGGRTDHIAPWAGCYAAFQAMRGEGVFVLGNGGHIQSIIAPPGGRKASYFTREGEPPPNADEWLATATLNEGSWWPHWRDWLAGRSGALVAPPRAAGNKRHPPLCAAPGTYVFS
ncbi:MAG TPA: alpha/beta fold hydrolase [Ramlibacter sp.]|nr:alpha/beta fold hydrolase [Ramlibacter sp.]